MESLADVGKGEGRAARFVIDDTHVFFAVRRRVGVDPVDGPVSDTVIPLSSGRDKEAIPPLPSDAPMGISNAAGTNRLWANSRMTASRKTSTWRRSRVKRYASLPFAGSIPRARRYSVISRSAISSVSASGIG